MTQVTTTLDRPFLFRDFPSETQNWRLRSLNNIISSCVSRLYPVTVLLCLFQIISVTVLLCLFQIVSSDCVIVFVPDCVPDYIQCPYCERRFSENAADRHMKFCKEQHARMQNKAKVPGAVDTKKTPARTQVGQH